MGRKKKNYVVVRIDRGLRILITQVHHRNSTMQLSKLEEKVVDFGDRCQQVARYLWSGRNVSITEQQLQWYDMSPHQVIEELLESVQSLECEEACEAGLERRFTVYCTKRSGVYVFKAKVIS